MKKALVLLLTLAMLATMVVSASAATITINKATTAEDYVAYRIFNIDSIAYEEGTTNIVAINYVPANASWLAFAQANNTLFALEGEKNYVTIVGNSDEEKAKDIAEAAIAWAEANAAAVAETKVTATIEQASSAAGVGDGIVKFDVGENLGYYVITSTLGSVLAVKSADADLSFDDKNEPTLVNKTVNDPEVAIGDEVTYTITFDGKAGATYTLEDKMSTGLTYVADSVEVSIGGTVVTTGFTLDQTATADYTFSITFDEFEEDKAVIVTCKAKVNKDAVTYTNIPNDVTLSYGNTSVVSNVSVKTYELGLEKVDANKNDLNGAEFEFQINGTTIGLVDLGNGEYRIPDATETTGLVTTLKADNTILIKGVDLDEEAKYTFVETKAPAGYNKLDDAIAVEIGETAAVYVEVVNKTGTEFPETGGAGTVAFYFVGSLLMLAAVVLFTAKKKMSVQG